MPPNGLAAARRIKLGLFPACLLPASLLAWEAAQGRLGANPIEAVTRGLGDWSLNFLLATLALTPMYRLTGWQWLPGIRRMLGMFSFFYACLHVAAYLWFDQFFDWGGIARDIVKRPFVTAGAAAFLLMLPLALTSNDAFSRRFGRQRWQAIHRAVYLAAPIAVVHYAWMVKRDFALPLAYGVVLAVLLGVRVVGRNRPGVDRP